MRKRIKLGITKELILYLFLSAILTIFIVSIFSSVFKISSLKLDKFLFPSRFNHNNIIQNYYSFTGKKINTFIDENNENLSKPHKLDNQLKEKFPYDDNRIVSVYFVDSSGDIINSNAEDMLFRFQPRLLKKNIFVTEYDSRVKLTEIKKLNENLYSVVIDDALLADDAIAALIFLVLWMILFLILIKGRLRYVKYIEKRIEVLYASEFSEKIALKYNNELTSLASTINNMADKIKEANEGEKEFLLNISHDLRTPLTSIIGFAKLLKEKKYDSDEQLERYIGKIEEKSLYLKMLINEFFEYSKLQGTNTLDSKKEVNIQEIIRQLIDSFYPQIKEKGIDVSTILPEKPLFLQLDIDKYIRALENIISNSINYSNEASILEIRLNEQNGTIKLEFWNTPSQNITETETSQLFKKFYKIDTSRNSSGTGLGLSIASEIIKLHGGKIKAELKGGRLGIIIEQNSTYKDAKMNQCASIPTRY